MRERPEIAESIIIALAETQYGLQVDRLEYLPLGADASSVVYAVDTILGERLMLKGRRDTSFTPASLLVPSQLSAMGMPHVQLPRLTVQGGLWATSHGITWSLFPFFDGEVAAKVGLTESQWVELGATLNRIHHAALEPETSQAVPKESFRPSRYDVLLRLETLSQRPADTRVAQDLVAFWRSKSDIISELMDRCQKLGGAGRAEQLPQVLCHADFHVWNILVEPEGEFWILDWDETTFAPKERDLMFVVGGISEGLVEPEMTASFLRGYGNPDLDQVALAYYRHAWALQDLAAYAEDVVLTPGLGEAARRESLETLQGLFEPGGIVSIALADDVG
jgi:spectinomycin phosphotransferase